MKQVAALYVSTLIAMVAIDFVWLSMMGERLYRPVMKDMMLQDFRPAPAIIFYLIFVAGLVYFAGMPALSARSWRIAALNGALLGFVAYATYDLTNQATLRNWATMLTVADLGWGTFVSAVATTIGFAITQAFVAES